ncbi:transcription termination/antitermination protein NusG [Thermoanaerobacter mathranii]|uniref:transcription termination/antitermination protein NusG n=1 Tax=Thermoanaerobacter mathranii TaxID=583357 RepID=UPI003D6BE20A
MQKPSWYAIQTLQNYEEKVKEKIEMIVKNNNNYGNMVFQIEIPVEEKTIIKNGSRKVKKQKLIPGYVFIKMVMTPEIQQIIRRIHGVKNFVGTDGIPVPISSSEIKRLGIKDTFMPLFKENETVIVTQGPFEKFIGAVKGVDQEKQKIKVELQIFGRNITIDFGIEQIEKLE